MEIDFNAIIVSSYDEMVKCCMQENSKHCLDSEILHSSESCFYFCSQVVRSRNKSKDNHLNICLLKKRTLRKCLVSTVYIFKKYAGNQNVCFVFLIRKVSVMPRLNGNYLFFVDKIIYRSGSLTPGEIILEINDKHVAGYTQTDSITLIKDSGDLLYVTSVYPG